MAPTSAPAPAKSKTPENIQEQIGRLAYEHYETRGREDGHDLEDWLRAEEEITAG